MKIKNFSREQILKGRKTYYALELWPFIWPLNGAQIGNGFAYYNWRKRWHYGLDIGDWKNYKEEVKSSSNGVVVFAGLCGGFGNLVVIRAGNNAGYAIETAYAHLYKINVKKGQQILKGQVIGLVGGNPIDGASAGSTTAPHLHFEVRIRKIYPFGVYGNYVCVDPCSQMPEIIHTKYGIITPPEKDAYGKTYNGMMKKTVSYVENETWKERLLAYYLLPIKEVK